MGFGGGVQLGSAYGKIVIDGAGALGTINQVRGGLLGLGGGLSGANVGALALGVGLTGIGVAAGGMAAAIGSGVKVAADLEAQLSGIRAVTGASQTEMAGLKALITDLGIDPNLKVSSLEAAAAIEMLGRNGLTAQEIMDGAARSVILLANATGGTFPQSADIATDVMALFNIEAENMGLAVDGITNVVNNSKFSIDDYALALAQGGGVAAAFGVSLDDFNTTIAAISPYFASGSDAGTSFKVMLQRLVPQSKEAEEAMAALGLEFFDQNGKMKEMGEIAGMLREKLFEEFEMTVELGGATEEMVKAAETASEKIPGLTTKITEQEAQLAILRRELEETTAKYGEGSIQADKKRLAIQKLTNDLEENRAKLGEQQTALDEMATATAETISTTKQLTEEQRNNTLATIFGTDGMRAAVGLAAQGKEGYEQLAGAITKTGTAEEAARIRMDNLAGAMEILGGVIETIRIRIGDEFLPMLTNGARRLAGILEENQDSIVNFFGAVADWLGNLGEKAGPVLEQVIGYINELVQAYQAGGLFGSRSGSFGSAGLLAALGLSAETQDTLQGILDGIEGAITAFFEGGFSGLADYFWNWVTGEGGVIASTPGMLDRILSAITAFLTENWPRISQALTEWREKFWDWVLGEGGVLARTGEALTQLTDEIQAWAEKDETKQKLSTLGESMGGAMVDGLILVANDDDKTGELLKTLLATLWRVSGTMLTSYTEVGGSMGGGVIAGIIEKITGAETSEGLKTVLGELWEGVIKSIIQTVFPVTALMFATEQFGKIKEGIGAIDWGEIGRAIEDGIRAGLWEVTTSMLTGYTEVGGSMGGGVIAGIIEKITGAETSEGLTIVLSELWQGVIETLIKTVFPGTALMFATQQFTMIKEEFGKLDMAEIGRNIVQGLIDGINERISDLVAAVQGMISAIPSQARSLLNMNSPSLVFVGIGENIGLGLAEGIKGSAQAPVDEVAALVRGMTGAPATMAAAGTGGGISQSTTSTLSVGDIIIQGAGHPEETAKAVRREMEALFGRVYVPLGAS